MAEKTLEQINDEFARLYANSVPIRSMDELDAAIQAAGLDYDRVTEEWLRSLQRNWVYLMSDEPFEDEKQNRAYRREMSA
jgi:hypothetical protein